MNKHTISRVLAVILALTSLLTAVSCGRGSDAQTKLTNVFRSETVEIPDIFDHIMSINCSGGKLYLYGYDNETYRAAMYVSNEDGSDGSKVEFEVDPEKNENVDQISIVPDGSFWSTVSSWYEDPETGKFTDNMMLSHFGSDGKLLESYDLRELITTEDENEYVYINSMTSDADGRLYTVYSNFVYMIEDGKVAMKTEIEADYLERILLDAKGNLLVFYYDSTDYKQQVKQLDPKTGEILATTHSTTPPCRTSTA